MTDVPGVLRDKDDPSTKYASLTIRNCKELVDEGIIAGGMIPKVGWQAGGLGATEGQAVVLMVEEGIFVGHQNP